MPARPVVWTDLEVGWAGAGLWVIRSAWDYHLRAERCDPDQAGADASTDHSHG